jgi:hypothetical protein
MGMYCDIFAVSISDANSLLQTPNSFEDFKFTRSVNVEKAWHGLHYLLTGSAWNGPEPLCFMVCGGQAIGEAGFGFGPARVIPSQLVSQLHELLSAITEEQLWSRFNAVEMNAQQIYPMIWDESEESLRDEYIMYFRELKQFIAEADREKRALVVRLV